MIKNKIIVNEITLNGQDLDTRLNQMVVDASGLSGMDLVERSELLQYAKVVDIPPTSHLATKADIENFITITDVPAFPSLEPYARVTDIPDISNLALKSEIPVIEPFVETPHDNLLTKTTFESYKDQHTVVHQSLEASIDQKIQDKINSLPIGSNTSAIELEVAELKNDIEKFNNSLESMLITFSSISSSLTALEDFVDTIKEKQSTLEDEVQEIQSDLCTLKLQVLN
jgi:hypothetical protein